MVHNVKNRLAIPYHGPEEDVGEIHQLVEDRPKLFGLSGYEDLAITYGP